MRSPKGETKLENCSLYGIFVSNLYFGGILFLDLTSLSNSLALSTLFLKRNQTCLTPKRPGQGPPDFNPIVRACNHGPSRFAAMHVEREYGRQRSATRYLDPMRVRAPLALFEHTASSSVRAPGAQDADRDAPPPTNGSVNS